MPSSPLPAPRAARRFLGALVVLTALGFGGNAAAANTIDPSQLSTVSGTVWQFLVDHASARPAAICYRATSHPEESFTCLVHALRTAGLDASLRDNDPVTLFAPTDAGFAELAKLMGPSAFQRLMTQPDKLTELLHNMMVEGRYTSADLQARSIPATGRLTLPTLAGTQLELTFGRFTRDSGRVEVRVGPRASRPTWEPYLVGQSTVLDNGAIIPMDMVYVPSNLR